MELTIKVQAPELTQALQTLANALGKLNLGGISLEPTPAVQQQPQNAIPVQTPVKQPQQQTIPTQQIVPTQTPVQPQTPVQQAVPTQAPIAQAPSYTMEDLARAAAQLMDAGMQQQLIALLGQFGVPSLNVLPKEQYGAFATALRGLGARI